MSIPFVKPTRGRIIVTVLFSLFFYKMPDLLPVPWKLIVILFIFLFFLFIPDQKGVKGGLIAGLFSLIFAGLGQLYVREYGRAFLFILIAVFSYMTTGYSGKAWVLNNVVFILSAVDAFSIAKRGIGII